MRHHHVHKRRPSRNVRQSRSPDHIVQASATIRAGGPHGGSDIREGRPYRDRTRHHGYAVAIRFGGVCTQGVAHIRRGSHHHRGIVCSAGAPGDDVRRGVDKHR